MKWNKVIQQMSKDEYYNSTEKLKEFVSKAEVKKARETMEKLDAIRTFGEGEIATEAREAIDYIIAGQYTAMIGQNPSDKDYRPQYEKDLIKKQEELEKELNEF